MTKAILEITPDLVIQALGLPDDTDILAAEVSFDGRYLRLRVHHADIPEDARYVRPLFTTYYLPDGKVDRVEFVGWNPSG